MTLQIFEEQLDDVVIPRVAWLSKLQRFPALMALCIQLGSAVIVGLTLVVLTVLLKTANSTGLSIPLGMVFLLQAVVSGWCAHYFKMAPWWKWIHFGFPLLVWTMLLFSIPTEAYFLAFAITASIYWSSYRTQVPYYPSALAIWQKVSALTHQFQAQYRPEVRVMEIGSGLGGFAMYIAKMHPEAKVEGVEVAPLPLLYSKLRSHLTHSSARFTLSDYQQLNFAEYDIIFAYLSPAAMPSLWDKAKQEQSNNQLLISLEFPVPGITPAQVISGDHQSPDLYIYQQ